MKNWVEEAVEYIVDTAQDQTKVVNVCSYSDRLPNALAEKGYLVYAYYPNAKVFRLQIYDAAKQKRLAFYSRSFVSGNAKFIYQINDGPKHKIIKPTTKELVEEIKNNCPEDSFVNMKLLLTLSCGINPEIFEGESNDK